MECKEDEIEETWRRLRVLIETSWNVKLEKLDLFLTLAPVLIETSWNVKFQKAVKIYPALLVLIETSWNVKTAFDVDKVVEQLSINRNIVECKDISSAILCCYKTSINRNIVECKDVLDLDFKIITFLVLIETSWNVKCLPQTIRILRPHCINRNIVECKDF